MSNPTTFKGTVFRSALEARWAAFFERLGWDFTYDHTEGDDYAPDFWLHGDAPVFVEVRPARVRNEYQLPVQRMTEGLQGRWRDDLLVLGVTPFVLGEGTFSDKTYAVAGWLGEYRRITETWAWGGAMWGSCTACNRPAVFMQHRNVIRSRPCSHPAAHIRPIKTSVLDAAWSLTLGDVRKTVREG